MIQQGIERPEYCRCGSAFAYSGLLRFKEVFSVKDTRRTDTERTEQLLEKALQSLANCLESSDSEQLLMRLQNEIGMTPNEINAYGYGYLLDLYEEN
jgi:hypothetical protein